MQKSFDEILEDVLVLLERRGRLTYRAIRRQFGLDEAYLEDLKFEIIRGQRLAMDEDGEVLVWIGPGGAAAATAATSGASAPAPAAPPHPQLAPRADAEPPRPAAPEIHSGERRQLTVMFCDLMDSTALASQLDPEDLRGVLKAYQATAEGAIARYDGHVAQYLGDGLLVYFGYPRAHDDDARRAILAGLAVIDAMADLNRDLQRERGLCLALRIGIHSGLVVVDAVGGPSRQEMLALGDTPNIAARVQALAGPNGLLVTDTTQRQVPGFFVSEKIGVRSIKGVSAPILLYRIVRPSGVRSRLEMTGSLELSGFVGREAELALLMERWGLSRQGQGQFALVGGEPGIGKSRLVAAVYAATRADGATLLEFRCSPYHSNSAYYPVIDALEKRLGFGPDEGPEVRLRRLHAFLSEFPCFDAEALPLWAALLGISLPEDQPQTALTPERHKQETESVLLHWLIQCAEQQPLLAVWEDLHWADPSTLALLGRLAERSGKARLFSLLTHRLEFSPPWPARSNITQLFLNRLSQAQTAALLVRLAGGRMLPASVVEQIIAKTDGVPLFVEEVTKLLLESGHLDLPADSEPPRHGGFSLSVPATLQASLMARLDRFSLAKRLAQLGAAIGREFSFELIRVLSPEADHILRAELDKLVGAELLYLEGVPPNLRYVFKHALIQDVAYQLMLKSDRLRCHRQIAEALEQHFPDVAASQPEILAHHHTEAGQPEPAVRYWQAAGELAIARSAHDEAIAHLGRGMDVLPRLPDTPQRTELEAALHIRLGAPLTATRGYCASEVQETYARALVLSQDHGATLAHFQALYGLWRLHLLSAQFGTAIGQAGRLLELAEQSAEPSFRLAAHRAMSGTLFYMGQFAPSRRHAEAVIAAMGEVSGETLIRDVHDVVDPRVTCLSYAAWASWMLGEPERAREESERALTLARDLDHPFSQALALSFSAWLQQFCGDVAGVREQAQQALLVSREHGFRFWVGWEQVMLGWAGGCDGDTANAVSEIETGLENWHATGSRLAGGYFQVLRAETLMRAGAPDRALAALEEAHAFAEHTEERWWEAECCRLHAQLLLSQGREPEAARTWVERGLALAREQGAVTLESRLAQTSTALGPSTGGPGTAPSLRVAR